MGVDTLRSCYEVDCRFFQNSDAITRIRYYWTDAAPLPIRHKFGSRNWLTEGEDGGPGEIDDAPRKWVNGSKCGSAPGDHYCGTPEQWLGEMLLPPDPPIATGIDGTPLCCYHAAPPMLSSGGQQQGLNRTVVGGTGGQRQGGRGHFQPLVAGGGQQQGGPGRVVSVGRGGQQQGGSGLFLSIGSGGQRQGGSSLYPIRSVGGQFQGGAGVAVHLGSGGQQQGEEGVFTRVGSGGQTEGGAGRFPTIAVGGSDEGGSGGFPDVPVTGSIIAYGSIVPPAGYLLCDGSAVSRTTYATLFGVIGTGYGAGDGSTTFNLPDFRGRFPLGAGTGPGLTARAIGATGGEETHALTTAELAVHHHAQQVSGAGGSSTGSQPMLNGAGSNASNVNTADTGTGTAHQNMPPFVVLAYMIAT